MRYFHNFIGDSFKLFEKLNQISPNKTWRHLNFKLIRIFKGVKTSADKIYILEEINTKNMGK